MAAETGTLNWFRAAGGGSKPFRAAKGASADKARAKKNGRDRGWDKLRRPARRKSFTDYLPWMEYLPDHKAFLLEDGRSVGAAWEVEPAGTEGRTEAFKALLWERAFNIVADAIPEMDPDPWVLQVFVSNDYDLSKYAATARDYASPLAKDAKFERAHHLMLERHYERLSRPGGVFADEMSGTNWRAKTRRVRFVLYRRVSRPHPDYSPVEELGDVAAKLELAFANAGVKAWRYGGEGFYDWLIQWFNPRPAICGGDVRKLRSVAPYPGDDHIPFGRDFAELLCFSAPKADASKGVLEFDGLFHAVLTTASLRKQPEIGQFTGERAQGDKTFAVMDRFPDEATLAMAIAFTPQDIVENQVARVRQASVGDQIDARLAGEEAEAVTEKMGRGDRLYPVETVVYVSGESERDLRRTLNAVAGQLATNGVQPISHRNELLCLDRWLGNLPMAFRPEKIKRVKRSCFQFASHIAASLPIYGRTRGTGHPGMTLFNRGGEPLTFDPLNPADRKKNGHLLLIGPTGAGKSAFLAGALMQMTAIYNPRLYIVEAGGSFNLLADHYERQGLTVNRLTLRPGEDISLPPFADALKLLDEDAAPSPGLIDDHYGADGQTDRDDGPDDERRDILGEMEIAARLMITGGQAAEITAFSRSDRLAVRQAIIGAAKAVDAEGGRIVRPVNVAAALRAQSQEEGLTDARRDRVRALADAMELFADDASMAGRLFNRDGKSWPDADVTVVDLAMLAREGYEAELGLAYVSLMNHINNGIERRQHERRQTIVATDEGHIITRNPLLSAYVVKITKMWRKLGAWYWNATQNLEDFPDDARRMLNMMEWWICLVMPKEEVDQIARFKDLDEDAKRLLLSARKEPGKYVEGVVLADAVKTIFRAVPPPLALALAMTEKHEKAARAEIMKEMGLKSELDAAYEVARRLGRRS